MKRRIAQQYRMTILALPFLMTMLGGCDQPTSAGGTGTVTLGDVILEEQYTNAAWAFILRGSYVDASGIVRSYEMHEPVRLPGEEKDGTWSRDSLAKKYLLHDTVRAVVPADSLLQLSQLAAQVEEKAMSDTAQVGADMGMHSLVIYRKDPVTERYRRILIAQWGDFQCRNTSPAAAEVQHWAERHLP